MPSSSATYFWQMHQLNNRGCVLMMKGNFFEANSIFEFAVKKFGTIEPSRNRNDSSFTSSCSCKKDCNSTCIDYLLDDESDCEEEEEEGDRMSYDNNDGSPIGRMTTNSQLRASSYGGQAHQNKYHQVYSLPIVMHDGEWDAASLQEKYNILLFNTSLCNHLLGMSMLKQETIHATSSNNTSYSMKGYQHFFRVAGMLYELALCNISTLNSSGINQLCHVAMFNNISHVYKTLQGCDSREAYVYDILLLKAIYWWKDSNSNLNESSSTNMMMNMSSPIYDSSSLRNDTTATVTESMMATSVTSATEEIIDSFVDNIFYLISASDTPASAA
jgi:hypothetical protein